MKNIISLLLCLFLGLPSQARAEQPRKLTATVFPVWILLKEVAKDVPGVNVNLLLPAGSGCPHDYAMTPNDRRRLAKADILVMNGLGLEGFLGYAAKRNSLLKPGASVVIAAQGLRGILPSEGSCSGHSLSSNSDQVAGYSNENQPPGEINFINIFYLTAMLSISTKAPFGRAFTANAERAGKSPSK